MNFPILLLFSIFTPSKQQISDEIFEFGDKMWAKCSKELRGASSTNTDLVCYRLHKHLLIRKVEVLSLRPFVLQYHNLVHRRLAKRAVKEAEQLQLEQLMIVGTGPTNAEKSEIRAANGTWLQHEDRPNFARMFRNLQKAIGALELRTAEPWQILSYNSDGYYAPHYDYLSPDTNKQLLEARGNRIATVLVILQIAKKGGTTVFPKIDLNIRPKAGDVIVWINFATSGDADKQTLHAACPIKEGTKIGATLWVHSKHQEFSLPCSLEKEDFDKRNFFD